MLESILQNIPGKVVFIIDDEPDFCSLMEFYLSKKGCKVYCFEELNEAIEQLEVIRPDVIFEDKYPVMSYQEFVSNHIDLIRDYKPKKSIIQTDEPVDAGSFMEGLKRIMQKIKDLLKW